MKIEVKKLCEAKQFSKAINLAMGLPEDRAQNLIAISEFLKAEKKGEGRDHLLKELIFALVERVGMDGIKMAIPLFELFSDRNSAKQLEAGVLQKAEALHGSFIS